MRSFEQTLSHRRSMSGTLLDRLGARLRLVLSVPDAAPADLQAAEAMIAAARCAFGPIEDGCEDPALHASAAPEAIEMHRRPLVEAPSPTSTLRPLRDCYPH